MSQTPQEPILASWKISEVLQRHPQLLDTLVELSPAFARLRNPLLRKVQTRLVTVGQAAGIAGIDPATLTRRLNVAAGITPPDGLEADAVPPAHEPGATPDWLDRAPVAETLDVRPLLERGEEPFRVITAAARRVPVGAVLRLMVPFEPLPLYDALAKQGFTHRTRREGETWVVDFRREREAGTRADMPSSTRVDWQAPATAEVTIDVSELVPPEPMVKILQALEALPEGGRLLVHHVRRPVHLYERLDALGYAHETRELGPGRVELLIRKPGPAS